MQTKITLTLMAVLLLVGMVVPCQAELVGLWKMDETSGNTAKDSTSNNNNGDIEGTATWETGVFNNALVLNGSNTYVELPIGKLMETLDNATLAIWALNDGAAQWSRIIDFGSSTSNYIYVTGNDGSGIRVAITDGTWYEATGDAMPEGEWQHVAVVLDSDSGMITLYQDGVSTTKFDSDITLADLGNTSNNWLGQSQYSADSLFTGMIDDFCIYNEVLAQEDIQELIEKGSPSPEIAFLVAPLNGETDVALDETLLWQAGIYAGSHDLYFGTSEEDVTLATRSEPRGVLIAQGITDTHYSFTTDLNYDQTYYWRVDEVNATSDGDIFTGSIWHFTAEATYLYPTPATVTASSFDQATDFNAIPENTINGSGMSNDLHSTQPGDMWRTTEGGADGAWIQYEFEVAYQFEDLLVWNYNEPYESFIGMGAKDVEIQVSMDGQAWTTLTTTQLDQATTGGPTVATSTINMDATVAKFVRINILSKWGTAYNKVGLSEVRFKVIPIAARRPSPADGTTLDSLFDTFVWRQGRDSTSHKIYLSQIEEELEEAEASALMIAEEEARRFGGMHLHTLYNETYFWRVDEVAGDQVTMGQAWEFSTPDHLVIDDMESYDADNYIYETWIDGFDENQNDRDDNGSEIGDAEPYVEQEICFSGVQSLPLFYDNTHGEDAAWVELAVDSQIFSVGGVEQFSVVFMGARDNSGGQFYVTIGNQTVTSEASLTSGVWTQMIVDLSEFGNLNSASSVTLGVAGNGETGVVYIDDVCLYREAPLLASAQAVEPSDDGLVVHYQMEDNLNDSAGSRDGQSTVSLFYENSLAEGALSLGRALSLEGLEDSYVDVNDVMGDLVASLTDSTYTAWVKLNDDSDQEWTRVFDFGTGTEAYMFLTPRSGSEGAPEFGILSPDSASAVEQDVAGSAMLTSGWHHLAVTIEQGDPNGLLTLYVDGVVADTDETDTLPADLGETTNNWLGRSQWSADGYFDGLMDEIRIYSRALSEGEIRWLAGDQ